MSFLSDDEKDGLSIRRMIFHVVGRDLDEPILLGEISPPEHADFFLERVKSALKGNLFEFRTDSNTERLLRAIDETTPESFAVQSKLLARSFQSRHKSAPTSRGVFFVFELVTRNGDVVYALIKYDNDDVVRYVLKAAEQEQHDGETKDAEENEVPTLERFRETFVRRADAMQKIALVRLDDSGTGGLLAVRDRSNAAHISEYFEGFLEAKRVNSPQALSGKLVEAFKATFKEHRQLLPDDIQRSGVNHIYEVMRRGDRQFDPDDCEPLVTEIFGPVPPESPLRKTLKKQLREKGVSEEIFDIDPKQVEKPRRRRMETVEGVHITFDEDHAPAVKNLKDGRTEILIVTARVTIDDVDDAKNPRRT